MQPQTVQEKPVAPDTPPEDTPDSEDRLFLEWDSMIKRDNLTPEGELIDMGEDEPVEQKKPAAVHLDQSQVKFAADMISSSLQAFVETLFGIEVPEGTYKNLGNAWAKAICTYYKGGILEFLMEWQPLLAALWATAIFAKAVRDGFKAKAERIETEKRGIGSDGQSQEKTA